MTVQQPWDETFARGGDGVQFVKDWLEGMGYAVVEATREQERMGIDLIATGPNGLRRSIEVKADAKAAVTGNAFVETLSVVEGAVAGWAYTSLAQGLVIVVEPARTMYLFDMVRFKARVPDWISRYQTRQSATTHGGRSWTTAGVCVPLPDLLRDAQGHAHCWGADDDGGIAGGAVNGL